MHAHSGKRVASLSRTPTLSTPPTSVLAGRRPDLCLGIFTNQLLTFGGMLIRLGNIDLNHLAPYYGVRQTFPPLGVAL